MRPLTSFNLGISSFKYHHASFGSMYASYKKSTHSSGVTLIPPSGFSERMTVSAVQNGADTLPKSIF
ncbi:hypothetical protein CBOM_06334 [Ceraceosorus bombacis]|uniref:Uncharacterized protein n=1 Tax=Ceraceosorus bombacis TaxID=401625 RepID=A0A0P1BST7_9BASI|nr:hypothetical protein CBOM_06334 [Ceraceosorus bombacis]